MCKIFKGEEYVQEELEQSFIAHMFDFVGQPQVTPIISVPTPSQIPTVHVSVRFQRGAGS